MPPRLTCPWIKSVAQTEELDISAVIGESDQEGLAVAGPRGAGERPAHQDCFSSLPVPQKDVQSRESAWILTWNQIGGETGEGYPAPILSPIVLNSPRGIT